MKLRIGIVCPYDYFRYGGVQEHIKAVAAELEKRGHYVKVIAPTTNEGVKTNDAGVILLGAARKLNTHLGTTAEITASASPKDIDEALERENFDILHIHEPELPILPGQIIARSNAKNVATFHAKLPESVINKYLEKATLPYTKGVVKNLHALTAVSEAATDYIRAVTDREVDIIPNGIEPGKFKYSKIPYYEKFHDAIPTVLYVGRLEKRKGPEFLVKAYAKIEKVNPNVRLVIVGDGPRGKSLKAMVKRLGLKNVHFLGFVSEADKYSLLKTATVYCSPAIFGESFGIVLLEAMLMRTPIVAGNNDGYMSVMKERGKLSIVDPKDIDEFSRRLEIFLYDTELRKLFVEWSDEYIKQFDYKLITDQYEKIYKRLLRTK